MEMHISTSSFGARSPVTSTDKLFYSNQVTSEFLTLSKHCPVWFFQQEIHSHCKTWGVYVISIYIIMWHPGSAASYTDKYHLELSLCFMVSWALNFNKIIMTIRSIVWNTADDILTDQLMVERSVSSSSSFWWRQIIKFKRGLFSKRKGKAAFLWFVPSFLFPTPAKIQNWSSTWKSFITAEEADRSGKPPFLGFLKWLLLFPDNVITQGWAIRHM